MTFPAGYRGPDGPVLAPAGDAPTGSGALWPVALVAFVLVAGGLGVVLAGMRSSFYVLEQHLVPKELVLSGTALLLLVILLPGWRRLETGLVGALLAMLAAWHLVSAVPSQNLWLAARGFGVTFSAIVVFFGARAVAAGSKPIARGVLAGLAVAAVIGGLLGVAQAYGAEWTMLAQTRPPGGTFGNRNFLAHLMAIVMPLLVMLTLRHRRGGMLIGFVGLGIVAAAIVLTRSRAAWLGAGMGLGVMAFALLVARGTILNGSARRRLVAMGLVIGAASAAAVLLPNQLQWRSETPYAETLTRIADYRGGSGKGRLIQWENSLAMARTAPILGVGPGNWFVHYPRVTTPGDPAFAGALPIPTNPWPSSDWVALLTERGAIAALLVLLAGAAILLAVIRRLRTGEPDEALAGAALLGTLVAASVTGAFDAVLMLPAPALFVASICGLLLPAARPVVSRPLGRRARAVTAAVLLGLATALTAASALQLTAVVVAGGSSDRAALERAIRFYPGDHRIRLHLAVRGRCAERLPHARAAAALMPYHESPRRALAACGVRLPR